jgi:uncharacterized protein (TIGR02246 family)
MPVVSFRPPVAPGAAAPEKQARDEEGVRKIASGFAEAWNRHDMKALSMLFAEDADFVNVVGLWWKGRSEIEKQHAAAHADWFKDSRLTMTATAIRFLAPDLAVVHPTWDLVGARGPLNLERAPRKGIMIQVMKREGGRWWIVAAQNTDIVPLPGPAPVKTPPAAGGRP